MHVDTWTDPHDIDAAVEFAMKYKDKCKLGVEPTCILSALYEKRLESIGVKVKFTEYKLDCKVHTPEDCENVLKSKRLMFSSSADYEKDEKLISWMDNFFC